jgi:hypothetical protein
MSALRRPDECFVTFPAAGSAAPATDVFVGEMPVYLHGYLFREPENTIRTSAEIFLKTN